MQGLGDFGGYLAAILRTMRHPLLVLDGTLAVETANRAFYALFAVGPDGTEGRKIYDLGNGQWNIAELRRLLEDLLPGSGTVSDFRVEYEFEQIGRRVMMVNATRMEQAGREHRILLSIEDVTERERALWELEAQKEYAEKIVDASRDALLILDWNLRVRTANDTFYQTFRVDPAGTEGQLVYELGNGQWNIPKLRELLENVLPENNAFDDFEVEHEFEEIGRRTMMLNARRIDHVQLILLAIEDRSEAGRAEADLREREEHQRFLLKFSDALRAEPDVDAVAERAIRTLSEQLRLDRCYVFTFDLPEERVDIPYQVGNHRVPPLPETVRMTAFPDAIRVASDRTLVICDVGEAEELSDDDRRNLAALQLGGIVASAVRKGENTPLWGMAAVSSRPRHWTVAEVALVEEVAERTWAAIERARAEQALRESDERQAFLLRLGDVMRARSSAHAIVEAAARLLGEHLGASRVLFAEFDETKGMVDIVNGWLTDGAQPFPETMRLEDYEGPIMTDLRAGRTVLVENARDPAVTRPDLLAIAELGVDALLSVPLLVDGRLKVNLSVHQHEPRRWTSREVALVEEIAERMWADVVRARTEGALGESEERYRTLFESMDEGFCLVEVRSDDGNTDYRVVEANPAFHRHTGFPDAIVGRWLREAAPDLEEHWYERYGRVARTGEPIRFEEGSAMLGRWFDVHAFRFGAPEDGRVAILFNDRTERKRQEEAVRESDERYGALFRRAVDGIWLARPDGTFVDVNPAACEMLGYPREAHLQYSVADIIRPEDAGRLRDLTDALGAGESVTDVWDILRADGTWLPLELSHSITPDGFWQAIGRDVTERRRAQEHQNMLMAELDHRVKNILAVVQSIARQTLGRRRERGSEVADRLIGRIDALAQSHALLASSRWKGARFGELIESAVAPYREGRAERIVTDGPDLQVTPKAAQTLTLALHELVTNAAKYGALSSEGGRVTAGWHLSGDGDDGRLVFDWQEHGGPEIKAPPTRKGFGSALIERTLAYELDGRVTLDFARNGLQAVIELPLGELRVGNDDRGDGRARRSALSSGSPGTLRGKKVLVVEDEYLVGQDVAEALQAAGCSVTGPVGTVGEALRLALTEVLDAAVLDINLCGEFVWPAARALRERGVPLVFATGYSDTVVAPAELADAPRIEKPVERGRLIATLAAALERRPGA